MVGNRDVCGPTRSVTTAIFSLDRVAIETSNLALSKPHRHSVCGSRVTYNVTIDKLPSIDGICQHRSCDWVARDIEEMMAERGVTASYESVREWSLKFGGIIAT